MIPADSYRLSLADSRCRLAARAVGVLLTLALSGCGDGRKQVFPVQGQVLDAAGKPAAGAKIIFHPLDAAAQDAAHPVAICDESGAFALTTYEKGDGAPAGSYSVTIEWRPPRASPFSPVGEDRLQGRFASVGKSPLRATVGKEPTTLEPFRVD